MDPPSGPAEIDPAQAPLGRHVQEGPLRGDAAPPPRLERGAAVRPRYAPRDGGRARPPRAAGAPRPHGIRGGGRGRRARHRLGDRPAHEPHGAAAVARVHLQRHLLQPGGGRGGHVKGGDGGPRRPEGGQTGLRGGAAPAPHGPSRAALARGLRHRPPPEPGGGAKHHPWHPARGPPEVAHLRGGRAGEPGGADGGGARDDGEDFRDGVLRGEPRGAGRAHPLPGRGAPARGRRGGGARRQVICGPLEAKGIIGVDDRNYVLDVTRATPRDALQRRGDAYEGQLSKGQGQRVECDAVRLATPRRGAGAVVDRGLRHGRPPRTPRFSLLPCSFFAHPWQSLSPSPPPSPASPLILRSPIPERRRREQREGERREEERREDERRAT